MTAGMAEMAVNGTAAATVLLSSGFTAFREDFH
jgi:hypothetical protein